MTLSTIEKVLFLQQVPLLERVPTEALAHIASVANEETVPAGGRLWDTGDAADAVYFVVEGEVVLRDGPAVLARALPPSDLGTAALMSEDAARETSAWATRDTTLLRVDREKFFEVLGEHPELAQALLYALGRRIRPQAIRLEAEPLAVD